MPAFLGRHLSAAPKSCSLLLALGGPVKAMERESTIVGIASDAVQPQAAPVRAAETSLQGSVLVLIQFDVAEEIRLDELRTIFGARTAGASFKHPTPGYVQYQ